MPNQRVTQNPYIGRFTNIEQVNEPQQSTTETGVGLHIGDLGQRCELTQAGVGTKEYQKVVLDSGATAATSGGLYAAGQTVYWKDKSRYIVTNDTVQAIGGLSANNAFRNEVAGVITATTITAGNATWIQQKGNNTNVKFKSGTPITGYWVVADTTAAQTDQVATTTAPVVQPMGKMVSAGAVALTTVTVDLDVPGIP